jgi:sulfoquinovosyltransferase
LYQPGDYAEAAHLTAQLVNDSELRQRIGAAARAEVEKFGWSAATKTLRETQYSRAIKVSRNKRRWVARVWPIVKEN